MNVPVETFGKDHWSLLHYIQSCCVNATGGIGKLSQNKMRCNPETHYSLSNSIPWKNEYSTRLFGFFDLKDKKDFQKAIDSGLQISGHDDWDCLKDLIDAGYIELISYTSRQVKFSIKGTDVFSLLSKHKLSGNNFASFQLIQETETV
jgi:hypothetical protein